MADQQMNAGNRLLFHSFLQHEVRQKRQASTAAMTQVLIILEGMQGGNAVNCRVTLDALFSNQHPPGCGTSAASSSRLLRHKVSAQFQGPSRMIMWHHLEHELQAGWCSVSRLETMSAEWLPAAPRGGNRTSSSSSSRDDACRKELGGARNRTARVLKLSKMMSRISGDCSSAKVAM